MSDKTSFFSTVNKETNSSGSKQTPKSEQISVWAVHAQTGESIPGGFINLRHGDGAMNKVDFLNSDWKLSYESETQLTNGQPLAVLVNGSVVADYWPPKPNLLKKITGFSKTQALQFKAEGNLTISSGEGNLVRAASEAMMAHAI